MKKKNFVFYLFLGSFYLLTSVGNAQYQPVFDHLTVDNGLSNSTVRCIIQDKYGYVWMGTDNGLNRYDGYNVSTYFNNPSDSSSLIPYDIVSLAETSDGTVFAGSFYGLCSFDRKTEKFKRYHKNISNPNGLKSERIYNMYADSGNRLWLCTDKGLILFDKNKGSFQTFTFEKNKAVYSIAADSAGNFYVATFRSGIHYFDTKNLQAKKINSDYEQNLHGYFTNIMLDSKGYLWLATNGNGLYRYNVSNSQWQQLFFSSDSRFEGKERVTDVVENVDGTVWVSTDGAGLFVYDYITNCFNQVYSEEGNSSGLSNNAVYSLFVDNSGILWAGNYAGGVNILNPKRSKFSCYTHQFYNSSSLAGKSILAVFQDKQNNIWIGTDGNGLDLYNRALYGEKFIHVFPRKKGLDVIKSITQDLEGNIWLGTYAGGLIKYNPQTKAMKNYRHKSGDARSISSDNVWALLIDSRGTLWVECLGGSIHIYDRANDCFVDVKTIPAIKSMAFGNTLMLFEDSKHRIWAVNGGAGLACYDVAADTLLYFKHNAQNKNSLCSNDTKTMLEDAAGNFWIGTGEGLNKLSSDLKTFSHYTFSDGLPSNDILSMVYVDDMLWLATNKGLSKYNILTGKFRNYDKLDGLQGDEFNIAAGIIARDGRIYLGGINGMNAFFPEEVKDDLVQPSVVITDILLFNKKVEIGDSTGILPEAVSQIKEITLRPGQSVLTLRFSAIVFTNNAKCSYEYLMDGFDEHWNKVGNKHEATYTNLDPGTYTFSVKAFNADGIESSKTTTLIIKVLPPFYKTWWFRLFVASIIFGFAWAYYFVRLSSITRQKKRLQQMVEQRTAELRNANFELKERNEEIQQFNEEIQSQTETLMAQRDTLEDVNEEVRTKNDQLLKAYENIEMFSSFGKTLTSTLNPELVSELIYNHVCLLVDTSAFGIGIINPSKSLVEFADYIERGKHLPFFTRDLHDKNNLVAYCIEKQDVIFINDMETEVFDYVGKVPGFSKGYEPLSAIYLPLTMHEKPIGAMVVSSENKNAYSVSDLATLQSLASYMAIALDNSQNYSLVDSQNKHIKSGMRYAQTIQQAILPIRPVIDSYFQSFILYLPKDIVSGDFYWFYPIDKNRFLVAVIDCTGHGVPGAFMSLIANSLLNDVVLGKHIFSPSRILEFLDVAVQIALKQDQTENKDGMDISLCLIERNESGGKIIFSGAKSDSLFYSQQQKQAVRIRADRRSIGGLLSKHSKIIFTNQEIEFQSGDMLYLSSDGFFDQNNPERARFGLRRFLELIPQIARLSVSEQFNFIENELNKHMQGEEQRDDITLWGIRL